jgi:hypothetical protein
MCFDPPAPSPFYGVVEADHHRVAARDEGVDKPAEQVAGQPAAGLYVAVEHAVIVGKLRHLLETHDAQGRRNGASARTSTCRQVGAANAARKGCIQATNMDGCANL